LKNNRILENMIKRMYKKESRTLERINSFICNMKELLHFNSIYVRVRGEINHFEARTALQFFKSVQPTTEYKYKLLNSLTILNS